MGSLGARELLILLLIALVVFGASRLPNLARSLGRSMRILKAETKGLSDEDGAEAPEGPAAAQPGAQQPQHGQPARDSHYPQQPHNSNEPDYPELPVTYHVVEETGEPSPRQQGS